MPQTWTIEDGILSLSGPECPKSRGQAVIPSCR